MEQNTKKRSEYSKLPKSYRDKINASNAKYHKRVSKNYTFRFNKEKDAEVIEKLESVKLKTAYIRSLILKDISEN